MVVLGGEGMSPVALLVLATTILFPLLQLCILFYLLVPLARERRPAGFAAGWCACMQSLRPWGMIEVFLLGVLVAIVKLSSMATVRAGAGAVGLHGLTVLLTAVLSFNPRPSGRWRFEPPAGDSSRDDGSGRRSATARARPDRLPALRHRLAGRRATASPASAAARGCTARKPDSLNRTWALLIAACILYLPANLLPVMITRSLLGTQNDTILSGVIYFWVSGA